MNKFASQLLQELGTALNVQDQLSAIIKDDTDFDSLNPNDIAGILIKASNTKTESLLNAEKSKIQELEEKLKTSKDEGYKSGERKAKEAAEAKIKSVFSLENSKAEKLDDLLEEVNQKIAASPAAGDTDKIVLELQSKVRDLNGQIASVKEEKEQEIANILKTYEEKETNSKIGKAGIDAFLALNPLLSDKPEKRVNQINVAQSEILKHKWKFEDGKDPVLLDHDGKPKLDENFNTIPFSKAVETITGNIFDFNVANPRSAPNAAERGDDPPPPADKLAFLAKKPENKDEALAMSNDGKKYSIEQRQAIYQYAVDKGFLE